MRGKILDLLRELLERPLTLADALFNRLYTWRFNPLYQSGTLVVLAFLLMFATGLYLLLFYRIGDPYGSIQALEHQVLAGRWIRALHRYAADLAVAAGALHAIRIFVQRKSYGPRALAWVSGLFLLALTLASGWTGYVMVWDDHAQLLALEGARLLDVAPIFSEPLGRAFTGELPIPATFFFLNLFMHLALPVGAVLLFWLHISRVARPILLPPRPLLWTCTALLFGASIAVPAPLGPKADMQHVHETIRLDLYYGFWLPLTRTLEAGTALGLMLGSFGALCLAPLWSRPTRALRRMPTEVNQRLCTGCLQCTLDCPYEALRMVELPGDSRGHPVSQVNPALCVSCGICTGSCAPMAIGPPARTGRDQLALARAFFDEHRPDASRVAVIACEHGAGRIAGLREIGGDPVFPLSCLGNLHSSTVEYLIRAGVGGVLLASCPPRDCINREGPPWLVERIEHGREAELRHSVDRRRIARVHAGKAERRSVLRALGSMHTRLESLDQACARNGLEIEMECKGPPVEAT